MTPFTREDLTVAELVSGHRLTIPIFRFRGRGKGPRVHIQASVHGAELQGSAVVYALLRALSQSHEPVGEMVLIPLANPYGTNYKLGDFTYGRFDPATGENWNRAYWEATCIDEARRRDRHQVSVSRFLEEHRRLTDRLELFEAYRAALCRALEAKLRDTEGKRDYRRSLCGTLLGMAFEADIVLDLHTAANGTRYVYVPEYALDDATRFDIPHLLLIPNGHGGAMDEACFVPWWNLAERLGEDVRPPVDAFTVELGSHEHIDLAEAEADARGILRYLLHKGAVTGPAIAPRLHRISSCRLADYRAIHAPRGGLIDFHVGPGHPMKAGESLGSLLCIDEIQVGRAVDRAVIAIPVPEAGIPLTIHSSSAVMAGTELAMMMTHVNEIEPKH